MKKISTSALSKDYGVNSKELFSTFHKLGFIETKDGKYILTDKGIAEGGEYVESSKYGKYIIWPENISWSDEANVTASAKSPLINSTSIGKSFGLSAIKINFMLSEIGWIQKGIKGWVITDQGKKNGGYQSEDYKSGIPFVRWPESILDSKILQTSVNQMLGNEAPEPQNSINQNNSSLKFREKFEAKHRTTDGHMVRSKAEMIIDNWLYMAEIVHAYERKLPVEEDVYCDFYIPTGKVYIEYWGYEDEPKYLARKQKKQEIYMKYGFNLIELSDKDVLNLDDVLPKQLLKFGVQAY